jgi:hypothetical protein
MKDGWVWVLFFKALIVDGGEVLGLYFFTFFNFHVPTYLGSLSLKGGGESGVWGFFIKNHFVLLIF